MNPSEEGKRVVEEMEAKRQFGWLGRHKKKTGLWMSGCAERYMWYTSTHVQRVHL